MSNLISADNGTFSNTAGIKLTSDTSGAFEIKTGNNVTAVTLSAQQNATFANTVTLNAGTANGVPYLNASKVLTTGSALTFNGTNVMGVNATLQAWSASARALQVGSAASFATSHNGVTLVSHNTYESAAAVFNYVNSVGAQQYQQSAAGGHIWNTAPAGTAGDVIPFTTRMSLSTAGVLNVIGNIGVNAASPAAPLDIRGSVNTLQARFGNVNTRGLEISTTLTGGTNDATTILNALGAGSGNLVLQTDSTERLRILQSGYVGIGTSAPGHILDIRNDADGAVYTRISNQNVGASSLAGLFIQGQGNEFYIRNYGDGTATPNRTDFYSGAGSSYFTFSPSGATRMRILANGNVVIGAESTTQPLEVVGQGVAFRTSQAANTNSTLRMYGGAYTGNLATFAVVTGTVTQNILTIGGGTGGGEPATTISFATGTVGTAAAGTTRMTLDNPGNLGLGVTPSAWSQGKAFEISAIGEGLWGNGLGDIWMLNGAYFNGGFKYSGTTKATAYRQGAGASDGSHSWHIAPSGTAGNAITFTQAMTLDASGNLGIGTSSPNAKLDIVATTNTIRLGRSTSSYATIDSNSNAGSLSLNADAGNTAGGGSMTFNFAGSERMRIDSSGNLLVGQTSSSGAVKQENSFAPSSHIGFRFNMTDTTYNNAVMEFRTSTPTRVGYIYCNASSTAYNTSSDYRLKENIAPMTGALAKVAALKPCTYKWKTDGSNGEGFIAHELAEVVPQCVTGDKDAVDAEGNPVYQGIDTSFLVATLTAAIQEQQAMIAQLQADIAALKGIA